MCSVVSEYVMPYCVQVVAGRHLAAERVAPVGDGHLGRVVGEGVDQHRHVQAGPAQGVGDGALVAEVGQRDQHAVDLVAVRLEQIGALPRILQVSTLPVLGCLPASAQTAWMPSSLKDLQDGLAAAVAQVSREEAAVADDHAQGHGAEFGLHGCLQRVWATGPRLPRLC